jgi:putative DNA primase/helicase
MDRNSSFDILAHLDQLEIVKESSTDYHCTCPLCGDGGFKIDKRSGKYNTFKCGCMDTPTGKKALIAAIVPDSHQKAIRPKQVRTWIYYSRTGLPLVRVGREDYGDGRSPRRWQESWDGQKWVSGLHRIQRENIPIYRYRETTLAIAAGQTIFIAEGEPVCDALWALGIPATTNIGGSLKWKPSDSKDLEGAKVVLCPDRDVPGVKHMEAIAADFPDARWLYAFPNSPLWNNLPSKSGLDLADWIADYQLSAADIWEAVEPRRTGLPNPFVPTSPPGVEENYIQKCVAALYEDKPWVAFNGKLYFWTGTHYQEASVGGEKRRIAQWCNSTPVQVGNNTWKYAYATATHIDNIWRWLHGYFSIAAESVNPPGINCLNGVVKIKWNGRVASWELVSHDPKVIYTYVSAIKFDPDADPTDCDRMLSCLEPKEQQLFVQTMAASLDLATIRQYRGRTVKALLCKGHGNNGKDTLREAVRLLCGIGMSNASVSDFAAYDNGRKFCLSKLEGARINWSSENSSFNSLDLIQSLKAAITGEPLSRECKGVDEQEMMLSAVFLFNVNEVPNLKAGMEAIASRWAVLEFNKTYKHDADPTKGEIEADSRFRYDPDFLRQQVCPALLNKMLQALSTVALDGIDYSCTSTALSNIQQQTNHLWAFARDLGLDYLPGGRVYINDLWERLREWYIDNGTLEIARTDSNKDKKIWHDQPRRSDKNVKAPNQIYQRFAELFPKIKRLKETEDQERRGQSYLDGIGFGLFGTSQLQGCNESVNEAVNLSEQGYEPDEAVKPSLTEISQALDYRSPRSIGAKIQKLS